MSDPDLLRRNFSFQMQIGLTREQVNVEGELTLASLKDIACAFVDRKVKERYFIPQLPKICNVYSCSNCFKYEHTQIRLGKT